MNEDFTGLSECQIDFKSDKAVGMFNKSDRKEVTELFANQVASLNTTSIAKVCLTEANTVDLMLQEFISQMAHQAKSGSTLRINLKVGYLIVRNQTIQFQQSNMLRTIGGPRGTSLATATESGRDRVSVATPSVVAKSVACSSVFTNNFHAGNPNPQPAENKNMSVRDIGLNYKNASDSQKKHLDLLKFGKKVVFDKRLTTKDVLEDHLAMIHNHISSHKSERERLIQAEQDMLNKVKQEMETQEQFKKRQQAA